MAPTALVVGAGMAGIIAARRLTASGVRVTLVDKGRAIGGRMATRRVGDARFDHGAQHFSARTGAFQDEVAALVRSGTVRVWLETPSVTHPERGVEARHVGVGGMRRVPEAFAAGLEVMTGVTVDALTFTRGRVTAVAAGRPVARADAAIITPPLPQIVDLLVASRLDVPAGIDGISYDATLAVLATLDRPADLSDGHVALSDGPVAWIADNEHKGVSPVPAITIHSSARFATDHLEDDPRSWAEVLLGVARHHHEGDVLGSVAHRWRYARPRHTLSHGALRVDAPVPVVLAGEVFAGARVEGAYTSGLAGATIVGDLVG